MEIEADMLDRLLNELKLEDVILFGHSDGGTIALLEAVNRPERILGVIAEAAHVFVEPITLEGIHETVKTFQTSNLQEKLSK